MPLQSFVNGRARNLVDKGAQPYYYFCPSSAIIDIDFFLVNDDVRLRLVWSAILRPTMRSPVKDRAARKSMLRFHPCNVIMYVSMRVHRSLRHMRV